MPATAKDAATILRAPFPAEQIGKLPRGGIQLDYVGHADVTSRLLEADPAWNWEPLATDEDGRPKFDLDQNGRTVGLWIKLTVGGVTRLGYGSVPSNQSDAVKVLIGDALRNAAMRFGVALDLWAKGDRAVPLAENASGPAGDAHRHPAPARGRAVRPEPAVTGGTGGAMDPDAQDLAFEGENAKDLEGLRAVYEKAREGGKLQGLVIGPGPEKLMETLDSRLRTIRDKFTRKAEAA